VEPTHLDLDDAPMRNRSKYLVAIGMAALAVAACSTMILPKPDHGIHASLDPALVERGRYIVQGPAHCVSCHGDDLAGGREFDLGPLGTVVAPNITSDAGAGIGALSDDALVRALRYGVSRHGKPLIPLMSFAELADEDLRAILSYLRTVPPVARPAPAHRLSVLGTLGVNVFLKRQGPAAPAPSRLPPERTEEYGRYLAHTLANCAGCHTQRNRLTGGFVGPALSGGLVFEEPEGTFVAPDLRAIANVLAEREFIELFRRRGAETRGSPMPWRAYARMTDTDLGAIYRYLRSLDTQALARELLLEPAMLLDGFALAEVGELEDLPDLDLCAAFERRSLEPLDRLLLRLALPDPVARDELLAFGERPIDDGALVALEADPRAFRARLQAVSGQHHARFDELFVVLRHLGKQVLARQHAGFGFLGCLDQDHETHGTPLFGS
jgi:mono/diheme cytochrome c family protein